jgi:hypothetical protein
LVPFVVKQSSLSGFLHHQDAKFTKSRRAAFAPALPAPFAFFRVHSRLHFLR